MASLLDRLSEKVKQAAAELSALKKERERLAAEVELMREENRRSRKILREHQELLAERVKIKERLEGLIEKLHKLKV